MNLNYDVFLVAYGTPMYHICEDNLVVMSQEPNVTISSLNYPEEYPRGLYCVTWFVAPVGRRIQVSKL